MTHSCAAVFCTNSTNKAECKKRKVSFFSFPLKDKALLKEWLHKLKRKNFVPNEFTKICSDHFTDDCFVFQNFTNRRQLKAGAIPTKFAIDTSMSVHKRKRISYEFSDDDETRTNDGCEGDTADVKRKFSSKPVESVLSQGTEDSSEYPMNSEIRGLCLIFIHKEFDSHTEHEKRTGAIVDAECLEDTFIELGFDVRTYTDLTVREVMNVLNKEAKKTDYSKFSYFVCCVLTHGNNKVLFAKDGKYFTEEIFAPFQEDVCPELAGKPKMFFIQACQGCRLDSGMKVVCKESLECDPYFNLHTEPDFLIVYSTSPGFCSWRNPSGGSYFIQALCEALEDHARDRDILQILTIVNRKVTFHFKSKRQEPYLNLKKQMPVIMSTLTRDLKFYP